MPASPRRRVLLVHTILGPVGGGEVVAAWVLEALRDAYDVTVLAWEPVEAESLNRYFGTTLREGDFRVITPPPLLRRAVDLASRLDRDPWSIQRYAALMRLAKRVRSRFEVAITTFNEADLGPPAIQYVHYPWCMRANAQHRAAHDGSPGTRLRFALAVGLRPWRLVSGFSFDRMRANLTLVNSDYTGRAVTEAYGVPTVTVRPPIPGVSAPRAWEAKEAGVVCVGRLSPEKRIEWILAIVARVRARGEDLRLHVAGKTQPDARAYLEGLRRRVREDGAWATLHEDPSREELMELIARQRFGIHGSESEPFGIAVAEMVRAGCVVFTPRGGGQVEITGGDERLVYDDPEEGSRKLLAAIRSPEDLADLRRALAERARSLDTDSFVARFRGIVAAFGAEEPAPG